MGTWTPANVERLNEHSLEDYLGRPRATAIYIVGGWVCHGFNSRAYDNCLTGIDYGQKLHVNTEDANSLYTVRNKY
jgi:hypothetical protein